MKLERDRPMPDGWMHRHSLNVRICHWINVIAFAFLVVSGIHILLDFPELYWGKVGFRGHPAAFKLSDWGLSWEQADKLGDRLWGRNYHFMFSWVFVINGFVYLAWNLWRRHFASRMLLTSHELTVGHLKADIQSHMHFRAPTGDAARSYGVLQKISYLLVVFVLLPFMLFSGLAQMPAFTAIAPWLIDLFGGRQTARTLHVACMLLLLLFVLVHVLQVFVVGAVNQMRAMITGKFSLPKDLDP